jgi:hypothetical protein
MKAISVAGTKKILLGTVPDNCLIIRITSLATVPGTIL